MSADGNAAAWQPTLPATPDHLAAFVDAGVLLDAEARLARRLGRIAGDQRDAVLLALGLALRAPRLGHVCVELQQVAARTAVEPVPGGGGAEEEPPGRLAALAWPDPASWGEQLAAGSAVREADATGVGGATPLVLEADRLYLDRYWRYEVALAAGLAARADEPPEPLDPAVASGWLDELFGVGGELDRQRLAAAMALTRHLTVVAGGPGTGKTYTVARVLATLHLAAGHQGRRPPQVALAAPTGKAAARLTESLQASLADLEVGDGVRDALGRIEAMTIHRLLGVQRGSATRFRHHAGEPLPHDVVVVDEASMVSLPLMAKLVDAVRPDARLLLLGDRDQLASVEAGAVLGDICGPHGSRPVLQLSPQAVAGLDPLVGGRLAKEVEAAAEPGIWDAVVRLDRFRRFAAGGGIAEVATAIQRGSAAALPLLGAQAGGQVRRHDPVTDPRAEAGVVALAADAYAEVVIAARQGRPPAEVLAALGGVRVLCAHRRGPAGVERWNAAIEEALTTHIGGRGERRRFYLGRPVLITENDRALRLANGDVGVVVPDPADAERAVVAFAADGGGVRLLAPARLPAHETTYAMTIHKSQGSQFDHAVVVLGARSSPLLTRELVYTAITRAVTRVTLLAGEAALQEALAQPVQRASGLGTRLWGSGAEMLQGAGGGAGPGEGQR